MKLTELKVDVPKPIMHSALESQIREVAAQFANRAKWQEWGLQSLRKQGAAVLLTGPAGCGKTSLANWLAWLVKTGLRTLDISNVGGGEPGQTERGIREFCDDCRKHKNITIFMDECDHIIRDRRQIVGGAAITWMTGAVEEILVQMNSYRGLWILASNHPENIDPAVWDRIMYHLEVPFPDEKLRLALWKSKWPRKMPLRLNDVDFAKCAKEPLSGRQIEQAIVTAASHAIRQDRVPTWDDVLYGIRSTRSNTAQHPTG